MRFWILNKVPQKKTPTKPSEVTGFAKDYLTRDLCVRGAAEKAWDMKMGQIDGMHMGSSLE